MPDPTAIGFAPEGRAVGSLESPPEKASLSEAGVDVPERVSRRRAELLHEYGCPRRPALLDDALYPCGIAWPRTVPALASRNHPVERRIPFEIDRPEQRLRADEPDGGGRIEQHRNALIRRALILSRHAQPDVRERPCQMCGQVLRVQIAEIALFFIV